MELFQDKKDKKDCTLDMGRGCEFCGCGGEELSAGVCEGCFKLHVTDWLKDYPDTLPGDIYEVRFKNTRRGYYQNVNGLSLKEGDIHKETALKQYEDMMSSKEIKYWR